jgi:NADH:ubiquinone oxidoreductase subunit H
MQRRVGPNVVGYYGIMQPCERHSLVKENWKTELYAVKYDICK